MALSPREREVVTLLRTQPQLDAAGLARALGTSKGAIAVVLSSLTQKGEIIGRGYLLRHHPWAVVVGGAAWDIKARSRDRVALGTSNPGTVSRTPGGVGRNIAEAIARLGSEVHLVAAVGADPAGRELLTHTAEAGVSVDRVITSPHATGSYLAALDETGELVLGISDFAATDALDVAELSRCQELIGNAAVVVIDANIPASVVEWVLAIASTAGVRVLVEPVSVAKAGRLVGLLDAPIFCITPNLDELAALTGAPVADGDDGVWAAARSLHARGVEHVWVSCGAAGSLLCSRQGEAPLHLRAQASEVLDVTGAGDAMTAGFVHGLLSGLEPSAAAELGQRAAALTVASRHTVRPDLGVALAAFR